MNQIIKLGVGIVLAGLLTACGSDGDSGGEEGILSKGGECVKIAHGVRERDVKFITRISRAGYSLDYYAAEVTKDDGKSFTTSTQDMGESKVTDSKFEYYIKNNYVHITKAEVTVDGNLQMTSVLNPYGIRLPSDNVCKGQTWKDEFSDKVTTPKGEEIKKDFKFIHSIEDINIHKTVEAGEFSTYIRISYFDKKKGTVSNRDWFDVKTGHPVYREAYNKDGTIKMTHELIEVIEGNL